MTPVPERQNKVATLEEEEKSVSDELDTLRHQVNIKKQQSPFPYRSVELKY